MWILRSRTCCRFLCLDLRLERKILLLLSHLRSGMTCLRCSDNHRSPYFFFLNPMLNFIFYSLNYKYMMMSASCFCPSTVPLFMLYQKYIRLNGAKQTDLIVLFFNVTKTVGLCQAFISAHLITCYAEFSQMIPSLLLSFPFLHSASNPCEENDGRGPCSHLCLINYNHTASCTCPHLMKLSTNKQSCYGEGDHIPPLSCLLMSSEKKYGGYCVNHVRF